MMINRAPAAVDTVRALDIFGGRGLLDGAYLGDGSGEGVEDGVGRGFLVSEQVGVQAEHHAELGYIKVL